MAGGMLGGGLGDAAEQSYDIATGKQKGWDFGKTAMAMGMGAVTSMAGAIGQWKALLACFVAGTPLEVPAGSKPVEKLRRGDYVLSRDEYNPDGPVVAKRVVEVFVRTGHVFVVRVRGIDIGTTSEHPFWVVNKHAWVPAGELEAGDLFLGRDGRRHEVEAVVDTGRVETVYNVQVEAFHTYFVGCQEWGFSVWAHNNDAVYRQGNLLGTPEEPTPVQGGNAPPFGRRQSDASRDGNWRMGQVLCIATEP